MRFKLDEQIDNEPAKNKHNTRRIDLGAFLVPKLLFRISNYSLPKWKIDYSLTICNKFLKPASDANIFDRTFSTMNIAYRSVVPVQSAHIKRENEPSEQRLSQTHKLAHNKKITTKMVEESQCSLVKIPSES